MQTNPFENTDTSYLVLVNDEGQRSLWPATIDVPAGWTVEFGPEARQHAVDHIEVTWQDMRPRSLVRAVEGEAA
ncbi:MbtH family protein [Streptomyces sp. NPDC050147]|uniref:MbtH family protein n=1 Tax=Streptomyces sp. NPDC050147 TaxID=3155513 RepID=UPI00342A93CB